MPARPTEPPAGSYRRPSPPPTSPPPPTRQRGRGGRWRRAAPRNRVGIIIALVAAAVLAVASVGVWWFASGSRVNEAQPPAGDPAEGPASGMQLASDPRIDEFYPAVVTAPGGGVTYHRLAGGQVGCAESAVPAMAAVLRDAGCKSVRVALYADAERKVAITYGYTEVGSEALATGYWTKMKQPTDPQFRFRMLIPDGSKIKSDAVPFYSTSYYKQFVTYALAAWWDGHPKEPVDRGLIDAAVHIDFQLRMYRFDQDAP